MAEKILYCASTLSHLKNFHEPHIKALHEAGFSVFTCCEREFLFDNADGCFVLPFEKRFLSLKNICAVFKARKLLLRENFDIISLNTTLAAAVIRTALLTVPKKRRPKVIYICHGFLFGKKINLSSLRFLIPEKLFTKVTDTLVVMNDEDNLLAKRHHLCKSIRQVNGMGLCDGRYHIPDENERAAARKNLVIADDDFVFICVGEFSKRKNQQAVIRAFADLLREMPNSKLIFAGDGALLPYCIALTQKLGAAKQVRFLGHTDDIPPLLFAADAAVSASLSEGLPFSVMEQLCCGLPTVISDIKGHRDLKKSGGNIILYNSDAELRAAMKSLYGLRQKFSCDMSRYLLPTVLPDIMELYHAEKEDFK